MAMTTNAKIDVLRKYIVINTQQYAVAVSQGSYHHIHT